MLSAARTSALQAAQGRSPARSALRPLILAALFGLALGGAFAAAWLGLERAWTGKATLALAIIAGSGTLAAIAAALAVARPAVRSRRLRFAAAFLCLAVGTAAFASLGLFLHALSTAALPEDSLAHAGFFVLTLAAGAAYTFFSVGLLLVLLPGLPLMLVAAALLARRPR